jgi:uncharacterized membrane protein
MLVKPLLLLFNPFLFLVKPFSVPDEREAEPFDLKTVGALVALATALLPVIGLVVRYVAFLFDKRLSVVRFPAAAAQPVSSLAELGFFAILFPLVLFLVLVVVDYLRLRKGRFAAVLVAVIVLGLVALGFILLSVHQKNWLLALIIVVATVIATLALLFRLQKRVLDDESSTKNPQHPEGEKAVERLGIPRAIAVATPALIAAILLGGLYLVRLPVAYVTFAHGNGVPNGEYALVGSDGDLTYLLSCSSSNAKPHTHALGPVVIVSDGDALMDARFYPTSPLPNGAKLGVTTDCPTGDSKPKCTKECPTPCRGSTTTTTDCPMPPCSAGTTTTTDCPTPNPCRGSTTTTTNCPMSPCTAGTTTTTNCQVTPPCSGTTTTTTDCQVTPPCPGTTTTTSDPTTPSTTCGNG